MVIPGGDPKPARLQRLREALRGRALAGAFLTRPEYGSDLAGEAGGPLVIGEARVFRLDGVSAPPWAEPPDEGEAVSWPGTPACAIAAAVRRVFAGGGVLQYFPDPAGHGLGLFARELPTPGPSDETLLPPGAALPIEPGLYVPGDGAFRLEVDVIITEAGCTMLGDLPPRLPVCGAPA